MSDERGVSGERRTGDSRVLKDGTRDPDIDRRNEGWVYTH